MFKQILIAVLINTVFLNVESFTIIPQAIRPCSIKKPNIPEQPKSKETELREKLFCNYNKHFIPLTNQSHILNVTMSMIVNDVDITSGFPVSMTLTALLTMTWFDEFLNWNPSDYDSISEITVNTDDIWKPTLYSEKEEFMSTTDSIMDSIECKLKSSGNISCTLTDYNEGYCDNDNTRWPYDIHACITRYFSWTHNGEFVRILSDQNFTILTKPTSPWEILNITHAFSSHKPERNVTLTENTFLFELQRITENAMPQIYIKLFVLFIISLSLFWVNPVKIDRTIIISISFMTHIYELQNIEFKIPTAGETIPFILSFYRDSLILCAISITESVILKKMITSEKRTPHWVIFLDRFTNRNAVQRILFIENMEMKSFENTEVPEPEQESIHIRFEPNNQRTKIYNAQVVDRLLFLIYLIFFVSKMFTYIVYVNSGKPEIEEYLLY